MLVRACVVLISSAGLLLGQSDRAEAAKNPFAGQPSAIAAGKSLYTAQCQRCHAQGFANFQRGSEDGEIFLNIRNGVRNSAMPAFTQLSTDQIWQIVSYLRTLNPGAAPATVSSTSGGGNATVGKSVFEGKGGCLACHQFNGKGAPVGPDLTFTALSAAQIQEFIENPNAPAAGRGRGRGRGRGGAAAHATVTATTADGKVYKGTRKSEDSFTIQMVDTSGVFHSFDRAALKDLKIDATSLMPADYRTRLSAAEIRDIAAYLKASADPAAQADPAHAVLTWNRILNSSKEPANWTTYWGNLAGTHYSALSEITAANVKNLQAQWMAPIEGEGQIQATPLVVDG
ncbi:MAG TPA: c-type cytochrome, partial [Bryobacteraceae bacterium]|nr:c-type cytochrome [Bryobacteraceae bacterium]